MLNMLRMGPILNGTIQNGPKNDKSHSAGEKIIQDWVEKYAIDGIISDRLGVLSKIPSVFYHTN
jgi:hypothetical protein